MPSTRSFTVFQDAPSEPAPKVVRPKAMTLRSFKVNIVDDGDNEGAASLNKENLDPLTGGRVGAATNGEKKRKVLATKAVAPAPVASKAKKPTAAAEAPQKKRKALSATSIKSTTATGLEPEVKKRKATTAASSKTTTAAVKEVKPKKEAKASTSVTTRKRTTVKKVAPMPPVNEEDEAEKEKVVQAEINSRVYDLTVKPLADVSEAYDASDVFGGVSANARPKFGTYKAASVEPEMRDYCFPPKEVVRRTSVARFRAASEGIPDHQPAFSTPERKKIYAAFTFSSPPRQANGDFL